MWASDSVVPRLYYVDGHSHRHTLTRDRPNVELGGGYIGRQMIRWMLDTGMLVAAWTMANKSG